MKKLVFLFLLILSMAQLTAQEIDYNDLSVNYRDIANQAFSKVSPATKSWFAGAVMQHPVGSFDLTWTNQTLREHFSATDMDQMGEIFALMMAYQKMLNKESREDRKLARLGKAAELKLKEAKLELEKTRIEQQKKEAAQRADNARTAATTEANTGIISASSQIAASTKSTSDKKTSTTLVIPDSLKRLQSAKVVAAKPIQKISIKQLQAQLAVLKTKTHI